MTSAMASPTATKSSSRVTRTPVKTSVKCTSRNHSRSVYASMPQPSSVKRRNTPTRTPTVTRPRRLILGRGLLRITNVGSHVGPVLQVVQDGGTHHYDAEHGLGVPPEVKVCTAVSASST